MADHCIGSVHGILFDRPLVVTLQKMPPVQDVIIYTILTLINHSQF